MDFSVIRVGQKYRILWIFVEEQNVAVYQLLMLFIFFPPANRNVIFKISILTILCYYWMQVVAEKFSVCFTFDSLPFLTFGLASIRCCRCCN